MAPTFSSVPERPDFSKEEEAILDYWKSINAFETANKLAEGRPRFSFYDGPPFATGLPHYGHLLAGTIKDVVTRYAYQTGKYVDRRFGWDCHGLPVEFEIDKKLGIKTRHDITDKIGITAYNDHCKSIVMTYSAEWERTVNRMGRWIDFQNGYKTMDLSFMESVWWVFKQLFDKGRVYRDYKVMPYSTACGTPLANFEANQNFKDVSDPSVLIAFPLSSNENEIFIAWTTTPWTLPSNIGIAVNPTMKYVKFSLPTVHPDKVFIVAECRLSWVLKEMKVAVTNVEALLSGDEQSDSFCVVEKGILGSSLVGTKYVPLFDFFSRQEYWSKRAFRVVGGDFVDSETGTGVVHCAPAFGEEDSAVMLANGITEKGAEVPNPVDDNGNLCAPIDDKRLLGLYVKDADKVIKQIVKEKNRLLASSEIVHSYPFCWRSDTPLIYKAVPSWFVKVEDMRELLLQNNTETRWVPDSVREKRFRNWLADARDWCVSRNRFWGTPIPLWVSSDHSQIVCIGSVAELQKYSETPLTNIHRQFVDKIEIPDPRGPEFPKLKRVEEVFDCWFESGSMPYAQVHYPFENREVFEDQFPADFVAEGLDQTRGWFYTLSVLGASLFGKAPFKNLIVNGLVLAADGKKMSKRLQNYPDPTDIINKFGADPLRLFLVSSPVVRAESVRFKEDMVRDMVKSVFLPWFHSYRFMVQEVGRYETSGVKFNFDPTVAYSSSNLLDRWILSLTHSLIKYFHEEMSAYRLYSTLPRLLEYFEKLTNWYVRLNRDRMRGSSDSEESKVSLTTLCEVLIIVTKLMCPFTPFTSEMIFKNLKNVFAEDHQDKVDSVHFCQLPVANEAVISSVVEEQVADFQSVVVIGRLLRDKNKTTIKTPVKEVQILCDSSEALDRLKIMEAYIQDELNAFSVAFVCDPAALDLSAVPNFKGLGDRVGKDMPKLMKAVKSMKSSEIKAALKNGSLSVEGYELTLDDLVIKRSPAQKPKDKNTLVECDDTYVVVVDFNMTPELEEKALCREIATRVQKLRKHHGLKLEDDIEMYAYAGIGSRLESVLASRMADISSLLRRQLKVLADDPKEKEPDHVLAQEQYELADEMLTLVFCNK